MLDSQRMSPERRIEELFNVAGPIDFSLLLPAHVVEIQPNRSHVEDSLFIDSPVDRSTSPEYLYWVVEKST